MLQCEQRTANSHNHSQNLRILYVTHYTALYGANLALYNLMLDMRERHGVIPSVLAPGEGDFSEICRKNGIEVFCSKFYQWITALNLKALAKTTVKHIINRTILYRKIIRNFKDKHFDIIHTNSSATDIGSILAHRFMLPHVWHVREFGIKHYNCDYFLPMSCVRQKYSQSEAVIAISQPIYDSLVNERRICPPENTRVIYDGLRVPEPYQKRQPSDTIHFCMTGLIYPGKNQLTAIHACAKLKALTDKFMLHIIGSGGDNYMQELKREIASCGLDEHVKFWGYRSDVDDILHTMDVGLMLSNCEAFGRVTVEYMLHYMPVIGVDSGATPEIVLDGETGYICPLNDADRIAESMYSFITNPELLHSMGSKGRERAVTHFSLERNTDEIYSLYQEILSTR